MRRPVSLISIVALSVSLSAVAAADKDKPSLGVVVMSLSDALAKLKDENFQPPTKTGVLVLGVMPKGPAAEAKIVPFSVLTRVNQKLVKDHAEFSAAVAGLELGKAVAVSGHAPVEIGKTTRWRSFTVRPAAKKWRDVVFAGLEGKEDAVTGVTAYRHVDSPKFVNERSEMFAAINVDAEDKVTPSLHFQYVASDWVFIRKVTVKADDQTFDLTPTNVHRDNSARLIWEWFTELVGPKEREMLDAMVAARTVIIRCEGTDYVKDRDLGIEEKARLYVMLAALDLLTKK